MRAYRRHEKKFDGLMAVIFGLVVWQVVDSTVNNPLVLVGPFQIAEAFTTLLASGELQRNVYATFVEFLLGYFVGITIGIAIGVLMGLNRRVKEILSPWVTISYNAPVILLAPLFITALGVGIASKIAITFIGAVFPVLFNTYTAMTTVDPRLVEAVQRKGAKVTVVSTVKSSPPMAADELRRQADNFIDLSDLAGEIARKHDRSSEPLELAAEEEEFDDEEYDDPIVTTA